LGLEAYKHFADINKPQDYRFWARYAQALEKAGKHEEVVQALGMVIDLNPDYEPGYLSLVDYIVSYFPTLDNVRAVVLHLEDFMRRHPDSAPVRERLNMMRAMLQDNSTSADN
jgi:tetratricopeptide (TPR) repeat protein